MIARIDRHVLGWSVLSFAAPAALGGLISWSWWGALTALFWAGLVRIAVLHHVTWSIDSICHMIGKRPFTRRDHSTNFWPLAVLSMGESVEHDAGVSLRLLYVIFRQVLGLVLLMGRTSAAKDVELLVLRVGAENRVTGSDQQLSAGQPSPSRSRASQA